MNQEDDYIDYELIWRRIQDGLSESEELKFQQWLNLDKRRVDYYHRILKYRKNGSSFVDRESTTHQAWIKLEANLQRTRRRKVLYLFRAAASILIVLAVGVGLWYDYHLTYNSHKVTKNELQLITPGKNKAYLVLSDGRQLDLETQTGMKLTESGASITNNGAKLEYAVSKMSTTNQDVVYNELRIPRGGEFSLVLSDGTKVWLNSETSLRYPVTFSSRERKVELMGEAYFEVTKDAKRPFVVKSERQQIKVYGTEFNVNSYPENGCIITTLVKGSIGLTTEGKDFQTMLHPNEQSMYDKTMEIVKTKSVNPEPFIAWKSGRLLFADQSLEEMVHILSKWYDVEFEFKNQSQRNIRFTGNLPRYEDINMILKKISKTDEVVFRMDKRKILIY